MLGSPQKHAHHGLSGAPDRPESAEGVAPPLAPQECKLSVRCIVRGRCPVGGRVSGRVTAVVFGPPAAVMLFLKLVHSSVGCVAIIMLVAAVL